MDNQSVQQSDLKQPYQPKVGFTLVELLVVIGIISVLIAILLPTLNKARDAANTVACLSNLRQIGVGTMMYTQEYKGRFPVTYLRSGVWWNSVPQQLYPYLKNAKLFICVSDPTPEDMNWYFMGHANIPAASYGFNQFATWQDGLAGGPWTVSNVVKPESVGYAADANWMTIMSLHQHNPTIAPSRLDWTHKNNSVNFLFADFHVENLNRAQMGWWTNGYKQFPRTQRW